VQWSGQSVDTFHPEEGDMFLNNRMEQKEAERSRKMLTVGLVLMCAGPQPMRQLSWVKSFEGLQEVSAPR